jgi:hypothetical protein
MSRPSRRERLALAAVETVPNADTSMPLTTQPEGIIPTAVTSCPLDPCEPPTSESMPAAPEPLNAELEPMPIGLRGRDRIRL